MGSEAAAAAEATDGQVFRGAAGVSEGEAAEKARVNHLLGRQRMLG